MPIIISLQELNDFEVIKIIVLLLIKQSGRGMRFCACIYNDFYMTFNNMLAFLLFDF